MSILDSVINILIVEYERQWKAFPQKQQEERHKSIPCWIIFMKLLYLVQMIVLVKVEYQPVQIRHREKTQYYHHLQIMLKPKSLI